MIYMTPSPLLLPLAPVTTHELSVKERFQNALKFKVNFFYILFTLDV